jgi:hypothetical protein
MCADRRWYAMVVDKARGTRITVDLGNQTLARALRVLAAAQGRPLRDVVAEALREWMERQEDLEDLALIEEVRQEPTRPFREILAEMNE